MTSKEKSFKHWVQKNKTFQIIDLPGLGIKDPLVVPAKGRKHAGSVSSAFLRVVPASKVFDIMKEVHCRELNHFGYKKCRDFVSSLYHFFFFPNIVKFNKFNSVFYKDVLK